MLRILVSLRASVDMQDALQDERFISLDERQKGAIRAIMDTNSELMAAIDGQRKAFSSRQDLADALNYGYFEQVMANLHNMQLLDPTHASTSNPKLLELPSLDGNETKQAVS